VIQAPRPDGDSSWVTTRTRRTPSLFGDETGPAISAGWFYRIDEDECAKCWDDQQVIHRKWRNDPND
jgi:hypothetical protein